MTSFLHVEDLVYGPTSSNPQRPPSIQTLRRLPQSPAELEARSPLPRVGNMNGLSSSFAARARAADTDHASGDSQLDSHLSDRRPFTLGVLTKFRLSGRNKSGKQTKASDTSEPAQGSLIRTLSPKNKTNPHEGGSPGNGENKSMARLPSHTTRGSPYNTIGRSIEVHQVPNLRPVAIPTEGHNVQAQSVNVEWVTESPASKSKGTKNLAPVHVPTQEEILAGLGVEPRVDAQRSGISPSKDYHGGYTAQEIDDGWRAGVLNRSFTFPSPVKSAGYEQRANLLPPPGFDTRHGPQLEGFRPNFKFPAQEVLQPMMSPGGPLPPPTQRDMLLKQLQGLAVSSSARAEGARTVMYDPAALPHTVGTTDQPAASESSAAFRHAPNGEGQPDRRYDTNHPLHSPTEPLQWKDRPVDVFKDEISQLPEADMMEALRKRELRLAIEFTRNQPEVLDAKVALALEAADQWWTQEGRRLTEYREYLRVHADSQLGSSKVTQGFFDPNQDNPTPASDVANRLLIGLLSTLRCYINHNPRVRSSDMLFGSYSQVPEWCVDTSVGGLTTFFGEDWGAPPARVGRDPRYRPLVHDPRYTLFEEAPKIDRWNGTPDTYTGRWR